jgi:broad specificity phosphatase PhoE
MTLYLIRHGKPAAVWGGGDDDPGLDETGRAQAAAVAARLLALPEGERPRAVVSSPLRRCRETAQPLADALGVSVEIDPAVGEIPTPAALGAAERPAWLRAAFTGAWADIAGDIDYDLWRRRVADAVSGRDNTAIFSHFVAINAAVSVMTGEERVISFRPDHTSVTTLAVENGATRVASLGAEAVTGVL